MAACSYQPHQQVINPPLVSDTLELIDTPFYPQQQYQCGPAALATVLGYSGVSVTPAELVSRIYIPDRRGSLQAEMVASARQLGRMPYVIDAKLDAITSELNAGRPVLVLQNLGLRSLPVWHYAVVIGYDKHKKAFILRSGVHRRLEQSLQDFSRSWSDSNNWGVVMLKPGQLPASPDKARYLALVSDLEDTQQDDLALQGYRAATRYWPDEALSWFGLGNVYYKTDCYVDAERAYRIALSLDDNNVLIMNNLAMTLAKRGYHARAKAIISSAMQSTENKQAYRILGETKKSLDACLDKNTEICLDTDTDSTDF